MKLSKENIQFIDNYLKNSQVEFFDIRMEMLDHVATAVEQKMKSENLDFYNAFKSYMVINKKELISRNEKLMKWNFKNTLPFFKFCIKSSSIFLVLICILVINYFKDYFQDISSVKYIITIGSVLLLIVIIQFLIYRFVIKERLYAVEKSGFILIIIYHLSHFFSNILYKKEDLPLFLFYMPIVLTFLYFLFYTQEIIKHRKFYLKSNETN